MRLTTTLRTGLLITLVGSSGALEAGPRTGLWELSSTLVGPSGTRAPSPVRACIDAATLERAPERALLDAAAPLDGSARGPAKCELADLSRKGERSAWIVRCDGPIGPMRGLGSGVLRDEEAVLRHAFKVDAPAGAIELHQTVSARRIGGC